MRFNIIRWAIKKAERIIYTIAHLIENISEESSFKPFLILINSQLWRHATCMSFFEL